MSMKTYHKHVINKKEQELVNSLSHDLSFRIHFKVTPAILYFLPENEFQVIGSFT